MSQFVTDVAMSRRVRVARGIGAHRTVRAVATSTRA